LPSALVGDVKKHLSDFESADDRHGFAGTIGRKSWRFDMPRTLRQQTEVLRLLLQYALGLQDLGRMEKLAWEIVFRYRGVECAVANWKLDLMLYVDGSSLSRRDAGALRTAINKDLRSGLTMLDSGFLRRYAHEQLTAGNVTVANQWHRLREMYQYFRDAATTSIQDGGRLPTRLSEHSWRLFAEESEAFYNTVAAVASYFGALEHLLLIAWPFAFDKPDPVVDVERFARRRSQDKVITVFGRDDRSATQAANHLARVGSFRNRHLHGGLDVRSWAFGFHLPGCGAVGMSWNSRTETAMLAWRPIDGRSLTTTFRTLDRFDDFLQRHGRSRFGWRWANSGLDVAFDFDSRRQYAAACSSEALFEAFLDYAATREERAVNMDW
jgi:hypothetical protein